MSAPIAAPTASWSPKFSGTSRRQREQLARAVEAQRRVWDLFSAPVAGVLADSLRVYADFGWRFDTGGVTARLVDDILARPLPDKT